MKKYFNILSDEELLTLLEIEGAYILALIIILTVLGSPCIFLSVIGFKGMYVMVIKLLLKAFAFTYFMAVFIGCREKIKSKKYK